MIYATEKHDLLKSLTKNEIIISEVFAYTKNKFIPKTEHISAMHNTYINTWETYYKETIHNGVFETLKKKLFQLNFPIEKGISKTKAYKDAILKGKFTSQKTTFVLKNSESIKLEIYPHHLIGKIPILIISNETDFTSIVNALSHKNEPQEIPKSMGAIFINGINNWNRIHELQENWQQKNPFISWNKIFKEEIIPNSHLYKDKLIILSTKYYSNIKPKKLHLLDAFWRNTSLQIRKEHECIHAFTLMYYGTISNNIHDELVADYAGILSVKNKFDKEWMLHFFGLENYPKYRNGGRLQNYLEKKVVSKQAFNCLKELTVKVINSIEKFDDSLGTLKSLKDKENRIKSICEIDFLTMALPNGVLELLKKYKNF